MVALASDRWAMLDPANLDAREIAAGSRLREGDYVGAEYQFTKILDLTENDPSSGWRIVTALLVPMNDQVRANKVLDRLSERFNGSENADALFARSQLAARFGELGQADDYIDQAIELEPGRADLLAWAGRLAVNTGAEKRALERYRQAWRVDPADPQVAMAYAELLKRSDDLEAAQEVLNQVPDTPEMRFARIVFSLDAGDRESAQSLYAGFSSAAYADASDAAFQAAQSAELLGFQRDAIDWYKKVTGQQSLRSILRQAFLLAELDDIEEARNLLARLRSQADNNVKSQSYLAESQVLQDAGLLKEALQLMHDALAELPDDIALRYTRALLAVGLQQLDLAESDLRQIIAVDPDNAAALNALGYTLADLTERFDEAEQLILQAYALQPEDASIIDSMGWVAYRLGRLEEAEAYIREAWKLMRNAEIAAHLGEVLWARGQKDEARSLWKLGLEMESDSEVLIKTMQRFGELP